MASATDYNGRSQQILNSKGETWPARTSCRWRDSNMAPGRIPRGFHWAVDGAGIAQLRATKASCRRRMFWKHSAILVMPAVATGRPQSGLGMQCDSRSPLRAMLTCIPARLCCQRASWCSGMFASEITGLSNMAIWNLTWRKQAGCGDTTMRVSRRWRNVFSSRI